MQMLKTIAAARATIDPKLLKTFERIVALPGIEEVMLDAQGRHDAQTLPIFAKQLEHVMAETYDETFPEMFIEKGLLPLDTSVPEGARTFVYFLYSAMGIARFASNYSSSTMPLVTIDAAMVSGNVQFMEGAYAYTVRDLRAARYADLPLESQLAIAEKRAHMELLNKTTCWGREDLGLPGLFNHPNITVTDAPNGAAVSPLWSAKTAQEIVDDITLLLGTVQDITGNQEKPNVVLIPSGLHRRIRTLPWGTSNANYTTLDYIQRIWGEGDRKVEFVEVEELTAANSEGNLSGNSLFAFTARDKKKAALVVPMPFKQHAVQQQDLNFKVPCESATGGVKMPYPLMAHRLDGV